jgi:hypothetical protein
VLAVSVRNDDKDKTDTDFFEYDSLPRDLGSDPDQTFSFHAPDWKIYLLFPAERSCLLLPVQQAAWEISWK